MQIKALCLIHQTGVFSPHREKQTVCTWLVRQVRITHEFCSFLRENRCLPEMFLNMWHSRTRTTVHMSVPSMRTSVSSQAKMVLHIKWLCTSHTRATPSLSWLTVLFNTKLVRVLRAQVLRGSADFIGRDSCQPASTTNAGMLVTIIYYSILFLTEAQAQNHRFTTCLANIK